MRYEITPENRVLKDCEDVGFIQDGICYTNEPPKGRGIASFRAMAGNPDLQFKPLPTGKESLQVEPISSAAVVDVGSVMESAPAAVMTVGAGILSDEPRMTATEILARRQTTPEPPRSAVLGDRDPDWQRWFVATHGEVAFSAKWPTRKLP